MDVTRPKKGLIGKTWERCKSLARNREDRTAIIPPRSDEAKRVRKRRVAPAGCFTVYVGPERQRFVVRTEYANHPLFRKLLEEAEIEYGYCTVGPLSLPCNVHVFCRVLLQMDGHDVAEPVIRRGCGFVRGHGSYQYRLLMSPPSAGSDGDSRRFG